MQWQIQSLQVTIADRRFEDVTTSEMPIICEPQTLRYYTESWLKVVIKNHTSHTHEDPVAT
jgi:hypothetical protein